MLDCKTPRGQKAIDQQNKTQRMLESLGYFCVNTRNDDDYSDVLLSKIERGIHKLYGVAEIKTRYTAGNAILTVGFIEHCGGYLITMEKIEKGVELAKILRVPFFLIVRLIGDKNKILVWKIWDQKYLFEFEKRHSVTQKTINGGKAHRLNAYLPIQNATIIDKTLR